MLCVSLCLKKGDKGDKGSPASSARKGHIDCVKYLVAQGAELEAQNNSKRTALHFSAKNGHLEVVKYLCQQGTDIEAKDKNKGNYILSATNLKGVLNDKPSKTPTAKPLK